MNWKKKFKYSYSKIKLLKLIIIKNYIIYYNLFSDNLLLKNNL